jgi:hypothetical protein
MTKTKAKKAAAKAAKAAAAATPSQWKGKSKATTNTTTTSEYCGGVSIAETSTFNNSASSPSSTSPAATHPGVEAWVKAEYRRRSEDGNGQSTCLPNLGLLQRELEQQRPDMKKVIFDTLVG